MSAITKEKVGTYLAEAKGKVIMKPEDFELFETPAKNSADDSEVFRTVSLNGSPCLIRNDDVLDEEKRVEELFIARFDHFSLNVLGDMNRIGVDLKPSNLNEEYDTRAPASTKTTRKSGGFVGSSYTYNKAKTTVKEISISILTFEGDLEELNMFLADSEYTAQVDEASGRAILKKGDIARYNTILHVPHGFSIVKMDGVIQHTALTPEQTEVYLSEDIDTFAGTEDSLSAQ